MKTKALPALKHLSRRHFEISVTHGPDKGASVVLTDEPIVVGTAADAQLKLTDDTVSARHCELSWRDGQVVARDLMSRNGLRVDGVRVTEAFPEEKAKLQLGKTTLAIKPKAGEELALSAADHFGPLYGAAPLMRALFAQLEAVAQPNAPLLLEGETGTGKDVTAEAVHRASPRAQGPFVVFDSAATAASLLEAELFGHERGAFTGAQTAREGLAEAAHGGTLLIDEVGELPLELQPKLLRLLERREVRRLGSNTATQVDVRIIAATHRPLRAMVKSGAFREDLFFRLSALRVRLPSLRERLEDLPGLVDRMLREHGSQRTFEDLDESDRGLLLSHRWPGNVRELRNVVERLLAFPTLPAAGLIDPEQATTGGVPGAELLPLSTARERATDSFERRYLRELLSRAKGNVSEAARLAQVSRQFLQRLLKKHGETVRG